MGPASEKLRILVVATRDVAKEARALLLEAGFPEPTLGDGGDETYAAYESKGPHIVLLGAHLERGDSRSLAAAMKGGEHGHFVRIILLGEDDGPIRTALDATDFEVDRFLARPLAAKALSFAVHSCGAAALKAQGDGAPAKPVPLATPVAASEPAEELAGPFPPRSATPAGSVQEETSDVKPLNEPTDRLPMREPTLIVSPHASGAPISYESGTSPKVIEAAIEKALDEVEADEANADDAKNRPDAPDSQTNPRIGFAATELSPRPDGELGDPIRHSHLIDEAMEAAIAEFVSDAINSVSVGLDDSGKPVAESDGVPVAGPSDETRRVATPQAPAAGMREPTLILSPSAAAKPVAPPPTYDVSAVSTEVPEPGDNWRQSARGVGDALAKDAGFAPGGRELSDDELLEQINADEKRGDLVDLDSLDDDIDDLGDLGDLDNLDDERTTKRAPPDDDDTVARTRSPMPVGDAPRGVNGPSSGAVARELRRKMSAMAERLFPGQVSRSGEAEAFSLPHDANTEIDFSALEAGQTGVLGAVPYRGIGRVQTFADTNPLVSETSTDANTAQSRFTGELGGEHEDIATLLARLHLSGFSGVVDLAAGDSEKTIHYDAGRPAFASSNLPRDRMGDLLFREGKISRAQHRTCNEKIEGSGRRMGELLVEMGYLKPRELLPAVRRHIEDIFYSVFAWSEGTYEVREREPSSERIRLSRHPAALVVEGVRRKYDLARLEARLGSADAILAPSDEKSVDSIIELADLAPDEQAALAMFDGCTGLVEIAANAELDGLTVTQLGFALVALGAAEIVFHTSEDEAATDSGRASALVGETDIAIDRQRVLAKLALVEDADYFMLLGVRRDASRFEIQRAYEAARRDYCRDSFPEPVRDELADELETINALIEEAFQILGNDGMRHAYLEHL